MVAADWSLEQEKLHYFSAELQLFGRAGKDLSDPANPSCWKEILWGYHRGSGQSEVRLLPAEYDGRVLAIQLTIRSLGFSQTLIVHVSFDS